MIDVWRLRKLRWLSDLPAAVTDHLRRAAIRHRYEAGALIFSPSQKPDFVYILESGLVRIFRVSAAGDEVSFGYVHPGEVFGELAAFGEPRESFAQNIRPSMVWRIPLKDFIELLRTNVRIAFEVARQIEGRFKRIENRVEDLVLRDAFSRLGRLLLQLCDEFGEPHGEEVGIDCALTQSDLATFIGTSRQTINAALSRMREEGLVSRRDDRIWLLRPDELRRRIQDTGEDDSP
jgi:CRP/FNR family cyclic AMP-dependent transcriptional regulator